MRQRLLVALVLLAGTAAHWNGLSGALVFDDVGAILNNPTLRDLASVEVLQPPSAGLPVTGRPVTNLSFALNYAVHGTRPLGYHVVNLAIHLGAALALFGAVRRVLRLSRPASPPAAHDAVAGATALLWGVHPLTTGAVTYVSQRAESLASLLLLLALYALLRHATSAHPRRWLGLGVAAAWIGVGVKETAYAIPLVLVACDRLWLAPTWRTLVQARGRFHALLFASWFLLAALILSSDNRGGTWAGAAGYSSWEYLRLQVAALPHYLRLVFWPAPLVFDYGRQLPVPSPSAVAPGALLLLALAAATVWALRRRSPAGLAGLLGFAVLAPSSSVVPLADPMFEYRMYLPAAAVLAVVIAAAAAVLRSRLWWVAGPTAAVLVGPTIDRNRDFATPVTLWQDTVAKRPDNSRARGQLGQALLDAGRTDEALAQFAAAYRLAPTEPLSPHNLAVALDLAGRQEESVRYYREALALQPANHLSRIGLGKVLLALGEQTEALEHLARAAEEAPDFADARASYGRALHQAGRSNEAIPHLQRATALAPRDADIAFSLGEAFARTGRWAEAAAAFRAAVSLRSDQAPALINLGNVLLLTRDVDGAIQAYRRALALQPDATAHANLGLALLVARQPDAAVREFEAALRLDPNHATARQQLGRLRSQARP